MDVKPFIELSAHKLIWGYEDPIYTLARSYFAISSSFFMTEKFGLLAPKNGTSSDVYTVNTGENDITKLGIIERENGKTKLGHWSTDDCNR